MADQIDLRTQPSRPLLVDGRNPFADENVSVSDPTILAIGAADANGVVLVTGLAVGFSTVTVDPGTEDPDRTAGSDDITVINSVEPTPLVVSLG